ncbi:MAG: cyclic nucleotide-binding protein, partial [Arenicellales bacterium]
EMGVIRNQPRSATLKAHGSTRCLRILADDFLNLLKDNPDVALGVLRQMADRLALAIETVESLRREQSR